MNLTKKQFEKVMHGTASEQELKDLIEKADKEIDEWLSFKFKCQRLLKDL